MGMSKTSLRADVAAMSAILASPVRVEDLRDPLAVFVFDLVRFQTRFGGLLAPNQGHEKYEFDVATRQ